MTAGSNQTFASLADDIIEELGDEKPDVTKLLADADIAQECVSTITDWGVPKPVALFFVRYLARKLVSGLGKGAETLAQKAIQQVLKRLGSTKFGDHVSKKLLSLFSEKAAKLKEIGQVEAILNGKRPSSDANHLKLIGLDIRTQLKQLEAEETHHSELLTLLDEIKNMIELSKLEQPSLHLALNATGSDSFKGIRKFHFRNAKQPFYGRRDELASLGRFDFA